MTASLTPFEQAHAGAAHLSANLLEAFAVNQMIAQAWAYEHDMAKVGNGAPPVSETIMINAMWSSLGQFSVGEA